MLEKKLKDLKQIKEIIEGEKKRGKKIVFTNGCFDILHAGHIHIFKNAKSYGDILIVAVNSDASIKKIKGEKRPIIPLWERLELLSSITYIDYIVVFEEETPIDLIRQIIPDYLVKGGDYSSEEVVGREVVESTGGKVIIIPLKERISTTSIIEKILNSYIPKFYEGGKGK
jgi:D-beta-D-heptose 7-phosphate kinase/D-beta-D-heptose 1-phosphate adenosyltransferase